jgi:NAD(P)-dependent dehydrogenase (short-subunit alcohol dehydrogenase family)
MARAEKSGHPRNVVVVGATSGIARPLARRLVARGWNLVITGRDSSRLESVAADLRIRGGGAVAMLLLDPTDVRAVSGLFGDATALVGGPIDGIIVCHGSLPDESGPLLDVEQTRDAIDASFTSAAMVLAAAAQALEDRSGAFLVAISSVAGDRGRQSNYTYGAAKAGLTAYLAGLRNRLHPRNVTVLTVKPGIVRTPMTEGLAAADSPLAADAETVARDIERAILQRRDVLYTPWFWWPVMTIICGIPEAIFKRLRL